MDDLQCLGMCMIDPDTGVCMGCGRLPEEVSGAPGSHASTTREKPASKPPLPPQVAAAAADPTD